MSGRRQECPLSPLLFNSLRICTQSNKAGRRNKGIQIGKEVVKLLLFVDHIVLYTKDSRNEPKNY
jgi:hypothetical protein